MSTVDVNPGSLRDAGDDLREAREQLQGQSNVHLLHGAGEDRSISTGGFFPGVVSQSVLTNHYQRVQEIFLYVTENMTAISSALHIVADVFQTTDQENALEFAFLNPNASQEGLPRWMRQLQNSRAIREQSEAQVAANSGDLPTGWRQEVHSVSPPVSGVPSWTYTSIYNDKGELVGRRVETRYPDGRVMTEFYRGQSQLISTTTRTPTGNGGYTTVTRSDPQGKGQDGRTRTETYRVDAAGGNEYTSQYAVTDQTDTERQAEPVPEPEVEFRVGEQPRVDASEGLTRQIDEQRQLLPNQQERDEYQENHEHRRQLEEQYGQQ